MRSLITPRSPILYGFLILSLSLIPISSKDSIEKENKNSQSEFLDLSSRVPSSETRTGGPLSRRSSTRGSTESWPRLSVNIDGRNNIETRAHMADFGSLQIFGEVKEDEGLTARADADGNLITERSTKVRVHFRVQDGCDDCIPPMDVKDGDLSEQIHSYLKEYVDEQYTYLQNEQKKEEERIADRERRLNNLAEKARACRAGIRVNGGEVVYSIDGIGENDEFDEVNLRQSSRRGSHGNTRMDCQFANLSQKDTVTARDFSAVSRDIQQMLLSRDPEVRDEAHDYLDLIVGNSDERLYRSLNRLENQLVPTFHRILDYDQMLGQTRNPMQQWWLSNQIARGIDLFSGQARGLSLGDGAFGPFSQAALCFTSGNAKLGSLDICGQGLTIPGGDSTHLASRFIIDRNNLRLNDRSRDLNFAQYEMPQIYDRTMPIQHQGQNQNLGGNSFVNNRGQRVQSGFQQGFQQNPSGPQQNIIAPRTQGRPQIPQVTGMNNNNFR